MLATAASPRRRCALWYSCRNSSPSMSPKRHRKHVRSRTPSRARFNATLDALVFDFDLSSRREVVLDVHLHLMAPHGTKFWKRGRRVLSSPGAPLRTYLASELRAPRQLRRTSTPTRRACSAAPRAGYRSDRPPAAAELYASPSWERTSRTQRHQTRSCRAAFFHPRPRGHDRNEHRTANQDADRPGTSTASLAQFAPRNINRDEAPESRARREGLAASHLIDLARHVPTTSGGRLPTRPPRRAWPSSSGSIPEPPGHSAPTRRLEAIEPGRPTSCSPACDSRSASSRRPPNGSERPVADITLLGREARRKVNTTPTSGCRPQRARWPPALSPPLSRGMISSATPPWGLHIGAQPHRGH